MKNFNITIFVAAIILSLFTCNETLNAQSKQQKRPKYIFFLIGDGFGLQHSMLAENYLDAKAKDTATCHLDLLKMPVLGTASTYSASSLVTCSSAAGTALSTGYKTKNNLLGVRPDSITPVMSIAKKFHDEGYNVGIISNATLDHATPAVFYAHVKDRNYFNDISNQMKNTGYEFFGGGSLRGLRDDPALLDTLRVHGYTVTENKDEIIKHKLSDGKLFAISPKRTKSGDIPYVIDNKDYDMNVPFYVKKAIDMFEHDKKSFFIMVEGGEIDFACHSNDPGAAVNEVLMFNEAYKLAYSFYLRHPDETLIVMTADHETGGMSIAQQSTGYATYPEMLDYQQMSGDAFNNIIQDMKKQKNKPTIEEIYTLISKDFGFNNADKRMKLNKTDSARIEYYYLKNFDHNKFENENEELESKIFNSDLRLIKSFSDLCLRIMSEKVGIGWTTGSHTGCCVPVRAIGVWQDKFAGFYDNTDIPKKIHGEE